MGFMENAGDYAVSMVDHLLDILTKGEHTKVQKLLAEVSVTMEINLTYIYILVHTQETH